MNQGLLRNSLKRICSLKCIRTRRCVLLSYDVIAISVLQCEYCLIIPCYFKLRTCPSHRSQVTREYIAAYQSIVIPISCLILVTSDCYRESILFEPVQIRNIQRIHTSFVQTEVIFSSLEVPNAKGFSTQLKGYTCIICNAICRIEHTFLLINIASPIYQRNFFLIYKRIINISLGILILRHQPQISFIRENRSIRCLCSTKCAVFISINSIIRTTIIDNKQVISTIIFC